MNNERKQTIQTYIDRIEQEREAIARSLEIIKVNREYIEEELAKDNVIKVDIN